MENNVRIVRVVTSNFVVDFFSKIHNMLGANMSLYEKMINKGLQQIDDELTEKNIKLKWYRYEITQLTSGAIVIMLYGDTKK